MKATQTWNAGPLPKFYLIIDGTQSRATAALRATRRYPVAWASASIAASYARPSAACPDFISISASARPARLLSSSRLTFFRRVLERGEELLELWIAAKVFQIFVSHQSIAIFVPAMDGFLQVVQRVVGAIGSRRHTGEVIPRRPRVSLS